MSIDTRPNLGYDRFVEEWRKLPELQDDYTVHLAWRRYQMVLHHTHDYVPSDNDPSTTEFKSIFSDLLSAEVESIDTYKFMKLSPNSVPWTATGLRLKSGQMVSTFASGRVWRSELLDMSLNPQFALWFKVGVDGTVFNSTRDSNTFKAVTEGELYVAIQYPGQFGEPAGGRLASPLGVYAGIPGAFQILLIQWRRNVDSPLDNLLPHGRKLASPRLIRGECERILEDPQPKVPKDWRFLWFLGESLTFTLEQRYTIPYVPPNEVEICMHCKPYNNVGILQKTLEPPLAFEACTQVSWDWNVSSLPSRLPENLTFTHDYLSIAFEFENGRDLTYTWSFELPQDFGYWCPLPAWADREYHVVIRSGTEGLGQWVSEKRDLHADYVRYIENGDKDSERMPEHIVRAWFIAGNRWQRFDGEMLIRSLQIHVGAGAVDLIQV